jgi:UDP-2,3-diacylglucosamine hydrolase
MSRSAMQKPDAIMDVDPSAVIKDMQAHKVTELIHGHTHRPGIHEFQVNNTSYKRIVLGGWYDEAQVLVCENAERKLIPVSDYLRDYNKPERFV